MKPFSALQRLENHKNISNWSSSTLSGFDPGSSKIAFLNMIKL